jgi:hypothetical protein
MIKHVLRIIHQVIKLWHTFVVTNVQWLHMIMQRVIDALALNHSIDIIVLALLFIVSEISMKPALQRRVRSCHVSRLRWDWDAHTLTNLSGSHHNLGLFRLHFWHWPLRKLKEVFIQFDHLLSQSLRLSTCVMSGTFPSKILQVLLIFVLTIGGRSNWLHPLELWCLNDFAWGLVIWHLTRRWG